MVTLTLVNVQPLQRYRLHKFLQPKYKHAGSWKTERRDAGGVAILRALYAHALFLPLFSNASFFSLFFFSEFTGEIPVFPEGGKRWRARNRCHLFDVFASQSKSFQSLLLLSLKPNQDTRMGNSQTTPLTDADVFDESVNRAVNAFKKHSDNIELMNFGKTGKKRNVAETSDEVEVALIKLIGQFSEISTKNKRYKKLQAITALLGNMIENERLVKDGEVVELLADFFRDLRRNRIYIANRVLEEDEYYPPESRKTDEEDEEGTSASYISPGRLRRSLEREMGSGAVQRVVEDEASPLTPAKSTASPRTPYTASTTTLRRSPRNAGGSSARIDVKNEDDL